MEISVQSLVASKTGKPAVELSVNGHPVQMSIKEARKIGLELIEAAEAAQSDSIVWNLFKPRGYAMQVNVLNSVREFRKRMDKECDIPPIGWKCTRERGHDGPCAAVEE